MAHPTSRFTLSPGTPTALAGIMALTDEQAAAVQAIGVWLSGPRSKPYFWTTAKQGGGLTTVVRGLVEGMPDARFLLTAPTARAAKRLEEQLDRPASTVHRLLYRPAAPTTGRTTFVPYNSLDLAAADAIIVEHAALLDKVTACDLLATGKPVLLFSDIDQMGLEKPTFLEGRTPDFRLNIERGHHRQDAATRAFTEKGAFRIDRCGDEVVLVATVNDPNNDIMNGDVFVRKVDAPSPTQC